MAVGVGRSDCDRRVCCACHRLTCVRVCVVRGRLYGVPGEPATGLSHSFPHETVGWLLTVGDVVGVRTEAKSVRIPPRPPTRTSVATDDDRERRRLLRRFLGALSRARPL